VTPRVLLAVATVAVSALTAIPLHTAAAEDALIVGTTMVDDLKAVYGTVETTDVATARARIAGTVTALEVDEGVEVSRGHPVARVTDAKLGLQIAALEARVQAAQSQWNLAKTAVERARNLFAGGTIPRARLDEAETAMQVADRALAGATADRKVISEQQSEGVVLAPAEGRVLNVAVTEGAVVMAGEPIATIAARGYVLRLQLPERHARFLREGDIVQVGGRGMTSDHRERNAPNREGRIRQVYPELRDGRVVADTDVDGLGDFFVGERVPVWVSTGRRQAIIHRAGPLPLRTLRADVRPARRRPRSRRAARSTTGQRRRNSLGPRRRRHLAAHRAGPMNLGLSGVLTRAFIGSLLTPLILLAAIAVGVIALVVLPREEEPQISVPMVDILVSANGVAAADAVELVTKPLEDIVKGIRDVEHVYSRTDAAAVVVTVRFEVGTDEDRAILRVHEEIRANFDRIPLGIPEPLIVGRGINDVPIVTLTLSPTADDAGRWNDNALYEVAKELQHELVKVSDVGTSFIVGGRANEVRVEPDPERLSRYGVTLNQLVNKVANANRTLQIGRLRDAVCTETVFT